MVETGIIRSFDDLGRLVIPRAIREKVFGENTIEGKQVEIFYENDGTIILKQIRTMTETQNKLNNMEDVREKLGEQIYDCIQENDNFTCDIGKYVFNEIMECNTQRELDIVNNMLIAITGYSIKSIIAKIIERDKKGYLWESIQ